MLWRITDSPHWLLGSIHILPDEVSLPTWFPCDLQGVERVVFESDYRDPAVHQIGLDYDAAHLEWPGVADAYRRSGVLLATYGIKDPFDALRPWRAAFYILGRLMPFFGVSHERGADNRLRTMAEATGVAIDYLESPTRAFELLDVSCSTVAGGLPFLEWVLNGVASGESTAELHRITHAWLESDLDDLAALHGEKLKQTPFMFVPLIQQRNQEWAQTAKKLVADPRPTLFVVGALHTVGSGSFIDSLAARGIECLKA
jgi:uncharacterized protein YbaP (TraB family)